MLTARPGRRAAGRDFGTRYVGTKIWSRRSGLNRRPGDETDRHLGADLRREVFLVFKESLNNAVRHSHCSEVAIKLRLEGSRLVLTVADDGEGFDPAGQRDGQGLRSMRRRAESLGGTLELASRTGGATNVVLTVPYRSRSAWAEPGPRH